MSKLARVRSRLACNTLPLPHNDSWVAKSSRAPRPLCALRPRAGSWRSATGWRPGSSALPTLPASPGCSSMTCWVGWAGRGGAGRDRAGQGWCWLVARLLPGGTVGAGCGGDNGNSAVVGHESWELARCRERVAIGLPGPAQLPPVQQPSPRTRRQPTPLARPLRCSLAALLPSHPAEPVLPKPAALAGQHQAARGGGCCAARCTLCCGALWLRCKARRPSHRASLSQYA